jgi:hypothetical protein
MERSSTTPDGFNAVAEPHRRQKFELLGGALSPVSDSHRGFGQIPEHVLENRGGG